MFNVSFGYSSPLKDYWRKGKLPTVTKDVYGDPLVEETIEHLIPKSCGGPSKLYNFGLANKATNNLRGNKPLLEYTTKENLIAWFMQFKHVNLPKLRGRDYIRDSVKFLEKNGIKLDIKI